MPETRCTVTDDRLAELSGLVVADGVWAIGDGGRSVAVHRLDPGSSGPSSSGPSSSGPSSSGPSSSGGDCAIAETRTADVDPYDVEDLALGPDGAMWVADIGDNERARDTVAAIVLPPDGEARLHRFSYPDGPHDAEALLVDASGVPYVITKEAGRPAGVYRTATPPDGAGPTPLELVAQVSLPVSETEGGPIGGLGSRTVTGAAATTDGRVVALRTYTDAWLFPVPDGDLTAAWATVPTQVPLPDEPQGEAVAFDADGALLSGSETRDVVPGELRAVPGAASLVDTDRPAPATPGAAPTPPSSEPLGGPPQWLPALLGGAAAVVLLAGAAAALSWRGRR